MSRKSLLALAFVAVCLGFTGQARAASTTYLTDLSLALTYLQDAYTESIGELSQETDDVYALYAVYFEAVGQAYLTLAMQNPGTSTGKYYANAGYQYAYWTVVYSWASFATYGYPRGNFSSFSAYIYALSAWIYAYSAYANWPSSSTG
jgi:hypothetical protein